MVRKTIFILMILLVIPVSLALVSNVPEKTNNQKLCITTATGSGEIIKFYINGVQQTITLPDLRTVNQIDAASGGENTGCVILRGGENKVEIKYMYAATEEFTVTLDTSAPQSTFDIADVVNSKTIILSVDEDSTLTIVINSQITTKAVTAGNPEIELALNEGINTVKIDAMDVLGNNVTILNKKITLDTKKPKVEIISIDGKEDIISMQTSIQIAKIIGKTEPGAVLKIFNLFDNVTYYYDKEQNKFLKSKNGEEITVFSMEGVDLDDGNFEAYVDLLPGKNTVVLLAADSANNQNTVAAAVNNINPTVIIDYGGASEHWNVVAKPASKIKALDILQKDFTAIVQIEFYPKDIDVGRLEDIDFSIAVPGQGANIRENKLIITASGQRQQPYYDAENRKYVTYQNINIQWPDSNIEKVPRKILTPLNGTITFGVGDRSRLITEKVTFNVLFDIETIHGQYLNPRRMRIMSNGLEDSLKFIRKSVAVLQKIAFYDAMGCAALKFWNEIGRKLFPLGKNPTYGEKLAEYLVCDRVLCYDTPPTLNSQISTVQEQFKAGGIPVGEKIDELNEIGETDIVNVKNQDQLTNFNTQLKSLNSIQSLNKGSLLNLNQANVLASSGLLGNIQFYQKGRKWSTGVSGIGKPLDYFHETACPLNMLTSEENPLMAPVRLKFGFADLYTSTSCACLPGMWSNLQHIYATLSAIQNCMDQARRGIKDPAECEVQIARASCSLSFWALEQFVLDLDPFQGRNYFVRTGGFVTSDIKEIWNIRNLPQSLKINEDQLRGLMYFFANDLYEEICVAAASLDWSRAKEITKRSAFEAIPSYGKLYVKSEIKEERDKLVVKYQVTPGIAAGTHSVRYRINFKCDGNNLLCSGVSDGYMYQLQPTDYLSGNIPEGVSLQNTVYLTDESPDFLYNSVDLELEWYVTDIQRRFTHTVTSEIPLTNENEANSLCNDKYKNNELCEKLLKK